MIHTGLSAVSTIVIAASQVFMCAIIPLRINLLINSPISYSLLSARFSISSINFELTTGFGWQHCRRQLASVLVAQSLCQVGTAGLS